MIRGTVDQVIAAFTEWERRYREEPERFKAEARKLAETPETYGDSAGPYFAAILEEIRAGTGEGEEQ